MKIAIALAGCLVLAGCVTVPVARNFPPAPPSLLEPCERLSMVPEGTTTLSQTLSIVTENYSKYHECQLKTDLWIEWYQQQKQIFDSVN
jgi:hypothetical protein